MTDHIEDPNAPLGLPNALDETYNHHSIPGFDTVNAYFNGKAGWVSEGKACWSSREKIARIQPDGIGFNFEVWRVDGFPKLIYCQPLQENRDDFLRQAASAGI